MRILITGAGGFVGVHLARHLRDTLPQAELHGTILTGASSVPENVTPHALDLRDEAAVRALLETLQPTHIFHLAAWAQVRRSFELAWETIENNVRVQLNILKVSISLPQMPRMLVVSSGEIYGECAGDAPTKEDAPLRPTNPYSVSKAAQDLLAQQYFLSHALPVVRARPFNHLGPGQSPGFAASDFALQIAQIEAGMQPPVIRVGDLNAKRDFTDVRDIVRAYRLLIEHGQVGEAYNVSSGVTITIADLLRMLLNAAQVDIHIESDTQLLKHPGVRKSWGDSSRLRALTGWQPTIPLEQTLHDLLEDYRARVRAGALPTKS